MASCEKPSAQAPLLATRRFAPLFWCQFFAAFDDNFFKSALALFILGHVGGERGAALATLATATLMAPYFILSSLGGEFADKYDKAAVAQRLKLIEIGAAALAGLGFFLGSLPLLFFALAAFGALGALFGPVKYAVLPNLLAQNELPVGNAFIEGATFVAILLGSIGGALSMQGGGEPALSAAAMIGLATASYVAARFMPPTPRAAAELALDFNIARATATLLHELWRKTRLWRLGLVTTVFWLIGAVVLALLPTLVTRELHGSELVVTIHFAAFAIAISSGSALAAYLLRGGIVLLPAAIGAAIAAIICADLALALAGLPPATQSAPLEPASYFAAPGAVHVLVDLMLLSAAGGLIIVPSSAALQAESRESERARVIGAVNVLNASAIVAGGLVVAALQDHGAPMWSLFIGLGLLAAASALWILRAVVAAPRRELLAITRGRAPR
ncbi:MAG TPA: MFS transporter [Methylocystis sp.]|nr:MFS transporter [Methylocystis sp.]